jgi:SAM-dependent methyltransferase
LYIGITFILWIFSNKKAELIKMTNEKGIAEKFQEKGSDKDFLWLNLKELPYFRSMLRAVEAKFFQQVELQSPTLDLGCGDGHFTSVAFNQLIDVGIDPWDASIREAELRNVYHLLTEAEGNRMPFTDGYFSSVFSNSVLEHIQQIEDVLAETARVMRPGALFVFCVPNHQFNKNLSVAVLLDNMKLSKVAEKYRALFSKIARHHHLDNPQTWQTRLERAGFVIERWWHYFPPKALAVFEWGHIFGLPSLFFRKITGRWIMVPARWNLGLIYHYLEPYSNAIACDNGTCTFFIAKRIGG